VAGLDRRAARDEPAQKLADRYDREAHAYRELWAPVLRKAGRVLLRDLAGARARRVLDVGSGTGALVPDLREAFPDALVLGVDRSRGMLSLAPAGTDRAVMDAGQLAVASDSVDLVLLVFMLFHLDRPVAALHEARRVLRAGGQVGTLTWGSDLESRATRTWTECLDAHGAEPAEPSAATRHETVDTAEKLGALLRDAGFQSPRCWTGDLVATLDAEHLIRLKTGMGSSKPRFDSLAAAAQEACVADARRRMSEFEPSDFVASAMLVYSVSSN
jgi:ubiquinone/menaquinone biosynthesis C-methylase UbiE